MVGDDKWIETSSCQRWTMPRWSLTTGSFNTIPWLHWAKTLYQHLGREDTLFLYAGDNPFYQEMARELQQRRQILNTALTRKKYIADAVARFIGLGIGLTPSSDDYLVGLSVILFVSGHPLEKYKEDFLVALQRAENNTTLISKVTLEAAFHQRYRECIARLVKNIITGQNYFITQSITDIKNIGSSSGCDMLYGIADACALSYQSGGNYVNQNSC